MNYISPPADLPPASIVDVYLRDSGGEGQDRSVASQLTEVTAYFAKHKWTIGEVYTDAARSGKSIEGRKEFERMLRDYESGRRRPHGLCLWDYARFARNSREAVLNIAVIENKGIIVHSLTDNIPDGEYKDLLRLVKHMGNQAEREKNSAAVRRELHQIFDNGAMFGSPPRGLKREPLPPTHNARTGEVRTYHKWIPDPSLAPLVLRAFEMKAQGATSKEILAATGLYKSDGCLTTFFPNKIYKGVLEYGGKVIENYCDPIVPPELWEEANRKRVKSTPGNKIHDPKRKRSTYLLSGLIHCQECGGALIAQPIKQYKYYACSNNKKTRGNLCTARNIPKEQIETAIIEAIKDNALDLEMLINVQLVINKELSRGTQEAESQRLILTRELSTATKEVDNLTRAIAAHGHSDALFRALNNAEMNQRDLNNRLRQLKKEIQLPRQDTSKLKEIAAAITHTLSHGSTQEQQHTIRTFVSRILVRRETNEIAALIYYLPVKIINPDERELLWIRDVPPRGLYSESLITISIPTARAMRRVTRG